MYIYRGIRMFVCIWACTCVHMCMQMYTDIYMYVYINTSTHRNLQSHPLSLAPIFTHVYAHTQTHTHSVQMYCDFHTHPYIVTDLFRHSPTHVLCDSISSLVCFLSLYGVYRFISTFAHTCSISVPLYIDWIRHFHTRCTFLMSISFFPSLVLFIACTCFLPHARTHTHTHTHAQTHRHTDTHLHTHTHTHKFI